MATSQAEPTGYPQNNQSADDEFLRMLMQHQRLLFVYLRTILNSTADAEEVLQEAYVVLWRKRHKFLRGTNFLNWAMTVAQYEVRNFRRRCKHVPQMLSDKMLLQLTSEMISEHDLVDARHGALAQCLDALNERDRCLVSTAYSINATKKDIGQRLGMTPSGFCKALHRVRQRLLKCIQHRLRAEGLT